MARGWRGLVSSWWTRQGRDAGRVKLASWPATLYKDRKLPRVGTAHEPCAITWL